MNGTPDSVGLELSGVHGSSSVASIAGRDHPPASFEVFCLTFGRENARRAVPTNPIFQDVSRGVFGKWCKSALDSLLDVKRHISSSLGSNNSSCLPFYCVVRF